MLYQTTFYGAANGPRRLRLRYSKWYKILFSLRYQYRWDYYILYHFKFRRRRRVDPLAAHLPDWIKGFIIHYNFIYSSTIHALDSLTIRRNVIHSDKSKLCYRIIAFELNCHHGSSWNSNNCFRGQIPATFPHHVGWCISILDLKWTIMLYLSSAIHGCLLLLMFKGPHLNNL